MSILFCHFLPCPPSLSAPGTFVIFSSSPSHAVTSVSVWHRPHQSVNNHDIARLQTPLHRHRQQIMKVLTNLLTLCATIGIKLVFFSKGNTLNIKHLNNLNCKNTSVWGLTFSLLKVTIWFWEGISFQNMRCYTSLEMTSRESIQVTSNKAP